MPCAPLPANMSVLTGTVDKSDIGGIITSEMFDKILKEKGPNHEIYLSYATLLAEKGQTVESLELLFHTYKLYNMTLDKLYQVISKVVDYLRLNWRENGPPATRNVFSCPVCWGVLYEPLTLGCGHTYCRRCLLKEQLRMCKICQFKFKDVSISSVKPNVLVATLVDRWWHQEVEGVKLRTEGNKYFQNQQLEKALGAYTKAFKCAPQDHLLLSNRSHVMHTMGRAEEALKDAEAATRCRPEWAKGYFRKAMALTSLGRFEDSIVSLLQCAILEESNTLHNIKDEITKAFHRLLVRLTCNRRYNVDGRSSRHHHCYSHHSSALSDPSIIPESDSEDSEDSEDGHQQSHCGPTPPVEEVSHLRKIMDKFNHEMERNKKWSGGYVRTVDLQSYDKNDFECTLCYRYLYQPVTTTCGHSFCRTCLDRCLDHSTSCPLCKTSIKMFLAERRTSVTEFIETAMQSVMPSECRDRKQQHDEELDELAAAGKDSKHGIPIFIATLAIPTISCPLHVFEPRYRLMIRRCMESGTREFGMCMPVDTAENGYADSGTMLEIRDIEYTADGRSIVNTVGSRRFRIVSKNVKDGYNTAAVEFLQDDAVPSSNLAELHKLHDCVHKLASKWYESIELLTKRRILVHYGPMPPVEGEYWTIPNGPAWMWWVIAILPLDHRIQLSILNETSLKRRLEILHKIVRCVLVQQQPQQTAAGGSQ